MPETIFFTVLAMSLVGNVLWLLLRLFRPLTDRVCSARWARTSRVAVLGVYLIPVGLFFRPLLAPKPVLTIPAVLSPYGAAASLPPFWALTMQDAKGGMPLVSTAALSMIWLVGVLVAVVFLLLRQRRFLSILRRTATPEESPPRLAILADLAAELGVSPAPALYMSGCIRTPLGVGLFHPAVYLPEIPFEPQTLELVLRHELTHLKQRDLLFQWFSLAALALHWFNPLTWAYLRECGFLCETACDEAVAVNLDSAGRRRYGSAILDTLCRAASSGTGVCSPFCSGPAGLKRRLKRILRPRRGRAGQAVCTLAVCATLALAVPISASVQAWAEPCGGWGDAGSYEANLARAALGYLPLGITYDAADDLFCYRGEPLSAFLDIIDVTPEQLAQAPDFEHIWVCSWFGGRYPSAPAYRTVRDAKQVICGLALLTESEVRSYYETSTSSVCFNSYSTSGDGRLYASDPAWDALPPEIRIWAENVPAGTTASYESGTEGYLCYGGLACPWQLRPTEDGGLSALFYPMFEVSDPTRPGVIHYTTLMPPTSITLSVADAVPHCD